MITQDVVDVMKNRQHSIDVLSPLACSVLFGRSGEAVRRAAREGHVMTMFVLVPTAKQIRFLELQSAIKYWAEKPWPSYCEPLEKQIVDMRRMGVTIEIDGTRFNVLHPYPMAVFGDKTKYQDDLE